MQGTRKRKEKRSDPDNSRELCNVTVISHVMSFGCKREPKLKVT